MHLFYISIVFIGLLSVFLGFTWILTKLAQQSLQVLPVPGFEKPLPWRTKEVYWISGRALPVATSASRYYNTSINREEEQLMKEIEHLKDRQEVAQWFAQLKERYQYRNIPKKVYLRATTLLNGYRWFDSEEYDHRVREGKPVQKVTEREYALEKKLELLLKRYASDKLA